MLSPFVCSVTLRLIVERVLLQDAEVEAETPTIPSAFGLDIGKTVWETLGEESSRRMVAANMYVQGELVNEHLRRLPRPSKGRGFGYHVFCSSNNKGSLELIEELMQEHQELGECFTTQNVEDLKQCDHMLVYLNGLTWTSGEMSEAFASEASNFLYLKLARLFV